MRLQRRVRVVKYRKETSNKPLRSYALTENLADAPKAIRS